MTYISWLPGTIIGSSIRFAITFVFSIFLFTSEIAQLHLTLSVAEKRAVIIHSTRKLNGTELANPLLNKVTRAGLFTANKQLIVLRR